jgi:hypothetical protein
MNYRVRRIDPYWMTNPIFPVAAVAGLGAALFLSTRGMFWPTVVAGLIGGAALIVEVKPGITAVLSVFGLAASLMEYLFSPRPDVAALSLPMRIVSIVSFVFFYTALMDGAVLLICVLYNFFAGPAGLEGFSAELEPESGEGGE